MPDLSSLSDRDLIAAYHIADHACELYPAPMMPDGTPTRFVDRDIVFERCASWLAYRWALIQEYDRRNPQGWTKTDNTKTGA
jgi:hypothetical protein